MNAIDHLSPASAEALALLTGQSGSGALPAPALSDVASGLVSRGATKETVSEGPKAPPGTAQP